jgi:hypothetical protein
VSNTSLSVPVAVASDTSTEDGDPQTSTIVIRRLLVHFIGLHPPFREPNWVSFQPLRDARARRFICGTQTIYCHRWTVTIIQAMTSLATLAPTVTWIGTRGASVALPNRQRNSQNSSIPLKTTFGMDIPWEWTVNGERMQHDIGAICPGLDAMFNCHLELANVEKAIPYYNEHSVIGSQHHDAFPWPHLVGQWLLRVASR